MAFYDLKFVFQTAAVAGLAIRAFGVTGLVWGCALMVQETRLALQNISEEAEFARIRFKHLAESHLVAVPLLKG